MPIPATPKPAPLVSVTVKLTTEQRAWLLARGDLSTTVRLLVTLSGGPGPVILHRGLGSIPLADRTKEATRRGSLKGKAKKLSRRKSKRH